MRKNHILFIIIFCILVFLPAVISFSQVTGKYQYVNKVLLSMKNMSDIESVELYWMDENRVIMVQDRQVMILTNDFETEGKGGDDATDITDENQEGPIKVKKVTNFLWVLDSGVYSPIEYIKELDLILLVEETPEPRLQMFNGNGDFMHTVSDTLMYQDFRIEYIKELGKVVILVNQNLLFYDYNNNEFTPIADNVFDYTYYPETKEVLLLETNQDNTDIYNLKIINPATLDLKFSQEQVTDAIFYPQNSKLFYTIPNETNGIASVYEIDYPNNPESVKEIVDEIAYNDFLGNTKSNITPPYKVPAKMSLRYNSKTNLYVWTQPSNGQDDTRTLIITEAFDAGSITYTFDNVLDYSYNQFTGDVILFYKGEPLENDNDNYTRIETRNLNDVENPAILTERAIEVRKAFDWYKEKNIALFLEETNNGYSAVYYDVHNRKRIFTSNLKDPSSFKYSEIIDNQVINTAFINNQDIGKVCLYFPDYDKGILSFDNAYYSKLDKPYSRIAILEMVTHPDGTTELAISFYRWKGYGKMPSLSLTAYGGIGINILSPDYVPVLFDINISYRFSRQFSIGAGLKAFYTNIFAKYSFINTLRTDDITYELGLKMGMGFLFPPDFGLGLNVSIEYTYNFLSYMGLSTEVGILINRNFGEDQLILDYSVIPFLNIGLMFHL